MAPGKVMTRRRRWFSISTSIPASQGGDGPPSIPASQGGDGPPSVPASQHHPPEPRNVKPCFHLRLPQPLTKARITKEDLGGPSGCPMYTRPACCYPALGGNEWMQVYVRHVMSSAPHFQNIPSSVPIGSHGNPDLPVLQQGPPLGSGPLPEEGRMLV